MVIFTVNGMMVQYSKAQSSIVSTREPLCNRAASVNRAHTNERIGPKATYHHITKLEKDKGSMVQYSKAQSSIVSTREPLCDRAASVNRAHTNETTEPKATYHHIAKLKKHKGSMIQYCKAQSSIVSTREPFCNRAASVNRAHTNETTEPKATYHISSLPRILKFSI